MTTLLQVQEQEKRNRRLKKKKLDNRGIEVSYLVIAIVGILVAGLIAALVFYLFYGAKTKLSGFGSVLASATGDATTGIVSITIQNELSVPINVQKITIYSGNGKTITLNNCKPSMTPKVPAGSSVTKFLEKFHGVAELRRLGWSSTWSDEPLKTMIKVYSSYLRKFGTDRQSSEIVSKYVALLIYGGFYVPLLGVPGITDVFMRLGTYVSIESSHDLIGRALTTWKLDDYLLEKILDNIVYRTGISATMYQPTISVTDPEFNIRISAVIGDVSNYRPFITIRVLPREPWLPTKTIAAGTADPETIATLGWTLVCKVPVIVFGETGAGKTTLLMALAQYVPPTSRVALIQDIKEIRLAGKAYRSTIIDLIVRYAYASGIREITWEDCFRQALRVTPDYILVPEVRGREARWLLEAFMTGHGGGSTIHAESGESVIERLRLVLREIGIDLKNIAFPILLARVAKTIEIRPRFL